MLTSIINFVDINLGNYCYSNDCLYHNGRLKLELCSKNGKTKLR